MRLESLVASCAANPSPSAREHSVGHHGGLEVLDLLISVLTNADEGTDA
jgi:hypothetical protein